MILSSSTTPFSFVSMLPQAWIFFFVSILCAFAILDDFYFNFFVLCHIHFRQKISIRKSPRLNVESISLDDIPIQCSRPNFNLNEAPRRLLLLSLQKKKNSGECPSKSLKRKEKQKKKDRGKSLKRASKVCNTNFFMFWIIFFGSLVILLFNCFDVFECHSFNIQSSSIGVIFFFKYLKFIFWLFDVLILVQSMSKRLGCNCWQCWLHMLNKCLTIIVDSFMVRFCSNLCQKDYYVIGDSVGCLCSIKCLIIIIFQMV